MVSDVEKELKEEEKEVKHERVEMQMEAPARSIRWDKMAKAGLLIIVVGALFLFIGYKYGKESGDEPSETIATETTVTTDESATTVASATTATDATADWKTYTNDADGFSFKYPAGWKLEQGPSEADPQKIVSVESNIANPSKTWPQGAKYFDRITVNKETEPSIADWISKRLATGQTDNSKVVTINNVEYTEIVPGSDPDYLAELKISNGNLYSIIFGWASGRSDISSTEEQILSTFQFTPVK